MLQTTLLTTEAEFDAIRSEWDDLLESSDQGVFFLRWHWNRTWWRLYSPPGSRLAVILCRDGQGRLAGLAPFYVQVRRWFGILNLRELCLIGTGAWVKTSEYVDIVARRGAEAAVGDAVAARLRAHRDWDRLWLWGVPARSEMLRRFRAALGEGARTWSCEQAPVLDTSGTWEETTRHFSHDVDRALRQVLSETRSCVVRVERPQDLEAALNDLVRLHQVRWRNKGQPGSFTYPHFEQFLREVAQDAIERGRLGLWSLTIDGRCVAVLIGFVDFERVHYFQSGFEPESPYSLGRIIVGLAIRDSVAANGIRWFDFMGGHGAYKGEWTSVLWETVELEYLPPGVRAFLFTALRSARRRLGRLRRAYRERMAARRQSASSA